MNNFVLTISKKFNLRLPKELCCIIYFAYKTGYLLTNIKFNIYAIKSILYMDTKIDKAIICAIISNNLDMLKIYMLNKINNFDTAIYCAITEKNIEIFNYLLNKDEYSINYYKVIDKMISVGINNNIIIEFINKNIKKFKICSIFEYVIRANNIEVFKYISSKTDIDETALNLAIKLEKYEIIKFIISIKEFDDFPIYELPNNKEITELLIKKYSYSYYLIRFCINENYLDILHNNINIIDIYDILYIAISNRDIKVFEEFYSTYGYEFTVEQGQRLFMELCVVGYYDHAKEYIQYIYNYEHVFKYVYLEKKFFDLIEDKEFLFGNKFVCRKILLNKDYETAEYIFENKLKCSYKYILFEKKPYSVYKLYKDSSLETKIFIKYLKVNKFYLKDFLFNKNINYNKIADYVIETDNIEIIEDLLENNLMPKKKYITNNEDIFKLLYIYDCADVKGSLIASIRACDKDLFELILLLEKFDYYKIALLCARSYLDSFIEHIIKNYKINNKEKFKIKLYIEHPLSTDCLKYL